MKAEQDILAMMKNNITSSKPLYERSNVQNYPTRDYQPEENYGYNANQPFDNGN